MLALALALALAVQPSVAADQPDREMATTLSLVVGFGSGHFYIGRGGAGAAFLLTEAGSLAMGTACLAKLPESTDLESTTACAITGYLGFAILHLVEALAIVPASRTLIEDQVATGEVEARAGYLTSTRAHAEMVETTMASALEAMGKNEGEGTMALRRAISTWMQEGYLPSTIVRAAKEGLFIAPAGSSAMDIIKAGLQTATPVP